MSPKSKRSLPARVGLLILKVKLVGLMVTGLVAVAADYLSGGFPFHHDAPEPEHVKEAVYPAWKGTDYTAPAIRAQLQIEAEHLGVVGAKYVPLDGEPAFIGVTREGSNLVPALLISVNSKMKSADLLLTLADGSTLSSSTIEIDAKTKTETIRGQKFYYVTGKQLGVGLGVGQKVVASANFPNNSSISSASVTATQVRPGIGAPSDSDFYLVTPKVSAKAELKQAGIDRDVLGATMKTVMGKQVLIGYMNVGLYTPVIFVPDDPKFVPTGLQLSDNKSHKLSSKGLPEQLPIKFSINGDDYVAYQGAALDEVTEKDGLTATVEIDGISIHSAVAPAPKTMALGL